MIEKLVADRFLTLPVFDQSPPAPDPTFPANFARALGRIYNIEESESAGPFYNKVKTSQVSIGPHAAKAHRTFRWLPWVLGKVSCVPLAGADILTGRMSGCWLVIFDYNGTRYAGHIGTDTSPTSANTLQAKAAWRNAVTAGLVTPVAAFNPVGPNLPMGTLRLNNEAPEFFGAFKASGATYTVVMSTAAAGGTTRRVVRVVQMPTTADVAAF